MHLHVVSDKARRPVMIIGSCVEHGAGGCRLAGCRLRRRIIEFRFKPSATGNYGFEPNVTRFDLVAGNPMALWSYGLHGFGSDTIYARLWN